MDAAFPAIQRALWRAGYRPRLDTLAGAPYLACRVMFDTLELVPIAGGRVRIGWVDGPTHRTVRATPTAVLRALRTLIRTVPG